LFTLSYGYFNQRLSL